MRTTEEKAKEGHFVVGVDFGTTFTSVAFAHTVSPEDIKLVTTWPDGSTGSGTSDQVPTEVQYTNPKTRDHVWGNAIPPPRRNAPEPLRWFKLLLQRDTVTDTHQVSLESFFRALNVRAPATAGSSSAGTPADQTSVLLAKLGITALQVVEDFLREIRKVTTESIENSYTKEFVAKSKFVFVVTIPAIWDDRAKGAMVTALHRAGYGEHHINFHLVTEPEAAAAYTLKVIRPHDFKENDTFVICDAGGGTVDLIAYKIQDLEPLRIDEVVSGTGDFCGSVYLDNGFRSYMEGLLGADTFEDMSQRSKAAMKKTWEDQVKFKFGATSGNRAPGFEVVVPGIPDDDDLDIEEGFHTISRANVQAIFDPIVEKIINLVAHQIDKVERTGRMVSAVLLVGGFGCSAYLFDRLRITRFSTKNPRCVQIIQPINARTAIARGALLRGLDGSIVSERRARRSYGITCSQYVPSNSTVSHKYWDDVDRCWRVPGKLEWQIQKDSVITHGQSFEIALQMKVPVDNPSFTFESSIYGSYQDPPGTYEWESKTEIYRICTLSANLSAIKRSSYRKAISESGRSYWMVDYTIKATMVHDVVKYELVRHGKSYGDVTAKFD